MGIYDLASVRVVVLETNPGRRQTLYDTLQGAGFRSIQTASSVHRLREMMTQAPVDMLVVDADTNAASTVRLLRDIRHGQLGPNPYLVFTAITWTSDESTIAAFVDAGADDVVAMPASVKLISSRVENLIDNRKEFVVANGYVGPDRRNYPRGAPDELGTFPVPNGLRHKATGDESAAVEPDRLRRINRVVDEHRLRRAAIRFEQLVSDLEERAGAENGRSNPQSIIREVSTLAAEIEKSVQKQRTDLGELASSMRQVVDTICRMADTPSDVFALARVHGQALLASLRGEDDASGLVGAALQQATRVVGTRIVNPPAHAAA